MEIEIKEENFDMKQNSIDNISFGLNSVEMTPKRWTLMNLNLWKEKPNWLQYMRTSKKRIK